MKGIQETTQGATGALNQPASNLSYIPLLQGLLDTIGWKSPSVAIYAEEKRDLERHLSLQEIEDLYEQNPSTHNRKKLLAAIDAEIAATKTELRNAQRRQKEAYEALMGKPSSGGTVRHLSSWLMDSIKSTVGSTPEQLIKHYNAIAKDRKAQIKKLSRYRNKIATSDLIFQSKAALRREETNLTYPSSFNLACLTEPKKSSVPSMGFLMHGDIYSTSTIVKNVGDINADSIDDFVVTTTYYYNNNSIYIIFGNANIGQDGVSDLSTLNGAAGFIISKLPTVASVSGGFDINADNIDDFIIGLAYTSPGGRVNAGSTYVIFGNPFLGKNGTLELSSLNGTTGFVINGVAAGDRSGYSVSSIGDFNADGFNDIAIGAPYASPENRTYVGSTYVLFGGPMMGKDGVLELSSLNATTRFILNGNRLAGNYSGTIVSYSGDINSDGVNDLLISGSYSSPSNYYAPNYYTSNYTYVVFGNKNLGFNGTLELSSLNGTTGFLVLGTAKGFGQSITYAGDINADGIDDFAIGSPSQYGTAAYAYIVFGASDIGRTGNIAISSLNGKNGLTVYERPFGYNCFSWSLSYAGDINRDGIDDFLIGKPNYCSSGSSLGGPGFVHLIFGGQSIGSDGLSSEKINGSNGFTLNGPETNDATGYSISSADINGDEINDIIISATYDFVKSYPPKVYVIFGGTPLINCQQKNNHSNPLTLILLTIIGAIIGTSLAYGAYKGKLLRQCREKCTKKSAQKSEPQTQAWPEPPAIETMDEVIAPTQSITSYRSLPAEPIELSQSSSNLSKKSSLTIAESTPLLSPVEEKTAKSPSNSSKKSLMSDSGEIKVSIAIRFADLNYDEKNILGKGAYGTVYKGTYNYNEVAIKKLHSTHLSKTALDELKQEAGILATMRSDFVVSLRGICLEPSKFCIVMELMPKGSLHHFLRTATSTLPPLTYYRIALDVAYGLVHLHQTGIIHRDLKSLNVLLDERLRAKVTDFGLAKIKTETDSSSAVKKVSGTLAWMAPELFDEKASATQASDIYALGMVLWELIAKPYTTPFKNLAVAQLVSAKLSRGEKQETIPSDCPQEYAKLIRSCWEKPKKRPDAKAIADNLYTLFTAAQTQPPLQSGLPPSGSTASVIPAYVSNPLSAT